MLSQELLAKLVVRSLARFWQPDNRSVLRLLFLTRAIPAPHDRDHFSFKNAVHRYEARLIRFALKETGGKGTAAARLLGFNHHQSLMR